MQNTRKAMNHRGGSVLLEGGWRWFLAFTLAAFALRLLFILRYPTITGDGFLYGQFAKNWLLYHVYGLTETGGVVPSYIRLPGYPGFLALVWSVAGVDHYNAVRFAQMFVDVGSCFAVADLARRMARPAAVSPQAMARWAFALAALCPFFANFTAAPLTETLAILFAVLAFDFAIAGLNRQDSGHGALGDWAGCGLAIAGSIYLRPDGGILLIAIGGYLLFRLAAKPDRPRTFWAGVVLGLCALGPLAPWTLRNWRVFHEFQPLSPEAATAPGEYFPSGFFRWMRTWLVDYASLEDVGFRAGAEPIDMATLPSRAFDNAAERARTEEVFDEYNDTLDLPPELDAKFEALAHERIRRHPLRYYIELPVLRALDMWFRPDTQLLPVDTHWWRLRDDPRDFGWSALLGAINLAYVGLGIAGLWRWRDLAFPAMLAGFVVLRTAIITVLTFPEPRYMLECYPVVIVFAAAALAWRRNAGRWTAKGGTWKTEIGSVR
jgi:hypothetical protein